LQPGDAYAGAPQLRRLLVAMGDLASASVDAGATLDPALCDGLRAFQLRHGLEPDGVLGPGTWRALTTPFDFRVRQIELTLERWRWLPPSLQAPSIFINIPQFQLFAFPGVEDAAAGMVEMNVVVGATAPSRHTPVFVADLTHLILRPYWDVPRNITVRELLPQIRAHANYLDRNALEIVDGSGRVAPATPANIQGLASGTLRLRQRPGPDNALGLVKFVLPNRFSIYLHDTPARALFARRSRAFSHGCIRLAEPTTLAEFLLRDDAAWTRERLVQAMNGTVPTRIDLPQPVRVFIVYGTALARERGDVLFFDDLYGHDARLAHLLGRR
ncbi:MAG: L,D-transpeptidase family protein, partial [Steroidobacteraceae bacterium]